VLASICVLRASASTSTARSSSPPRASSADARRESVAASTRFRENLGSEVRRVRLVRKEGRDVST